MITIDLPNGLKPHQLFKYIIGLGFVGTLLVMGLQLYTDQLAVFFPTSLCSILLILVYILNWKGARAFSYHLLIIGFNTLFLYMVVIGGNKFHAIYSIYIVGLVFTFIFFKQISILLLYLSVFLISQLLILYYSGDGILLGLTAELLTDGICLVVANLGVFLMCYFYLSNLEKAKIDLELATKDFNNQEKELKERSNELTSYIESNIQLENYTHLAAHELRAPLKSVKGFADILKYQARDKLDSKEKEMFNFISEKTEKMDVLLKDLSVLGRVSQIELTPEYINLDELFKDILIDRNDLISSRDAEVEFKLVVQHMVGQLGLIKQLFSNLIGNALKFVEASKIPQVKVTVEDSSDGLLFKVMDNGIGIKPEHRNRIFQIFERLHSETEFKGSGIGLSISKKIVDLHKGTIHIQESELGGSCFVVRLPKLKV